MTLPGFRLILTDLNGTDHTITDDVQSLETSTALSNATDTFSFSILNDNDEYSYIEKGCAIQISTGIGTLVDKINGYITEVVRTLDSAGIKPILRVSGEDSTIRLNDIYFSGRFYNMELSALIHAIMSSVDYSTGKTYYQLTEIFASPAQMQTTPYTISEATYTWKSLAEAIKEIAELAGYVWYIRPFMGWKLLYFSDPTSQEVLQTIVDADLEGTPEITDVGNIVNRAVVVGGWQQNTDKSGLVQSGTVVVSSSSARNQAFTPAKDYLSSVMVYTELVSASDSSITLSIQNDSAGAPDGVNIANGYHEILFGEIVDGGYTEFRFESDVTLTPGVQYWIVLKGTTATGVKVGVNGATLDYKTRYPSRVAVMANDFDSQERYKNSDGSPGIYMQVHRDSKLEDAQMAEVKANEMLMPIPKKVARLKLRDERRKAGDVVRLTISETGIDIDKTMKILSSTQSLGEVFIYNSLEMEEI